jgi:multidrug efflux pump subunit AcrB
MILRALMGNSVLANLVFVLVLALGIMSYQLMPRQQDPTVNFNWIVIVTSLPGASAEDMESRVTQPLEDALRKVSDVKFISSTSRVGISNVLVRFRDLDDRLFDKRVNDLRREIQNKRNELPKDIVEPMILEITSANAFPTASIVLKGKANDELLRSTGFTLRKELERLSGVDRVDTIGLDDPELQVALDMQALANHQLSIQQVANAIGAQWQDVAAGKLLIGGQQWLLRHIGQSVRAEELSQLVIARTHGEVRLADVAQVYRSREDAAQMVRFNGDPAIMMAVMKKDAANTLQLVERLSDFLADFNRQYHASGLEAVLADDQTLATRSAINTMESNALQGLILVLLVAWLFLGWRVGLLIALGIPFSLAGAFIILYVTGETLNLTVLLGVIIALGMLVDDAVVIVEAMTWRIRQGMDTVEAAQVAIAEVGWPVLSAVLTTVAAFLPLMLLPGILGDFMRVVPLVVTIALFVSLIEAFWMMPVHTHLLYQDRRALVSVSEKRRAHYLLKLQNAYGRLLVKSFRYPLLTLSLLCLSFISAIVLVTSGRISTNFFATDPVQAFYVNVEMPSGTPLEQTLSTTIRVEQLVRRWLHEGETRSVVSYAGQMFTETEPRLGDVYGQIFVSLSEPNESRRSVDDILTNMREALVDAPKVAKVSLLRLSNGPPAAKPISIKVRGDDYQQLRLASQRLMQLMTEVSGVTDISDDAAMGSQQLITHLNIDAIEKVGLDVASVVRSLRVLSDGEVIAQLTDQGQKVDLRLRSQSQKLLDLEAWQSIPLSTPSGKIVPLGALVDIEIQSGFASLRHHNYRRAITVEADLDKSVADTLQANRAIQLAWAEVATEFPEITLDFSGELDDLNESLSSMGLLFVLGIGLMYLILGAQFKSYWQPLLILVSVPMAFTGVAYGLWLNDIALSLYTLYGVIALSGIAVNSAIVLIAAANDRRRMGMSVLHSTVYAARRRLVPILITSTTTIAGLIGLALGVGGFSLIFTPVAIAIVWGILVSTVLTLFTLPLLYRLTQK